MTDNYLYEEGTIGKHKLILAHDSLGVAVSSFILQINWPK